MASSTMTTNSPPDAQGQRRRTFRTCPSPLKGDAAASCSDSIGYDSHL